MRDTPCTIVRTYWQSTCAVVSQWPLFRKILVGLIALMGMGLIIPHIPLHWQGLEENNPENISILIARTYIPAFTLLKPDMVALKSYPREFVVAGAVQDAKELIGENARALFSTAVPLPAGHPITHNILLDLTQNHGVSALLPPGKVAVSFSADRVRGVGGWVEPGDTIAIFSSPGEMSESRASASTRLLFSNVHVLAVDKHKLGEMKVKDPADPSTEQPDSSESDTSVMTVLMTPFEATALTEAREQGHLSVLLRSLGDDFSWPLNKPTAN